MSQRPWEDRHWAIPTEDTSLVWTVNDTTKAQQMTDGGRMKKKKEKEKEADRDKEKGRLNVDKRG